MLVRLYLYSILYTLGTVVVLLLKMVLSGQLGETSSQNKDEPDELSSSIALLIIFVPVINIVVGTYILYAVFFDSNSWDNIFDDKDK